MYEQRDGTHPTQLLRMQELSSRVWSWSSRWHPGELTWFWWEHGGPSTTWQVSTWRANERTVAWAWSKAPGRLDLQIDPAHPDVLEEILAWFAPIAGDHPRVITIADGEIALIDALSHHGYLPDPSGPYFAHLWLDLVELPVPSPLPPGMTFRSLRGEQDAQTRAEIHRAAFGGSGDHQPTTDAYRSLMADGQYRSDLDWIVEEADGTPAAFCLSWIDEPHAVAVLEPVGTAPRHRRRGLAQAAIVASLGAAAAQGARHARVCARGDGQDAAAIATYESLGFRRYARNLQLTHDPAAGRR